MRTIDVRMAGATREGMVVGAIGIVCRRVLNNGTLGPPSSSGTLAGGSGGTGSDAICINEYPVAVGIRVRRGSVIDSIN